MWYWKQAGKVGFDEKGKVRYSRASGWKGLLLIRQNGISNVAYSNLTRKKRIVLLIDGTDSAARSKCHILNAIFCTLVQPPDCIKMEFIQNFMFYWRRFCDLKKRHVRLFRAYRL